MLLLKIEHKLTGWLCCAGSTQADSRQTEVVGHTILRDVAFLSDLLRPSAGSRLYTNVTQVANPRACNILCLQSKNASWVQPDGKAVTVNCTLWRFCNTDASLGCPSESPDQYSQLRPRECQLYSLASMDQGSAQSPFQALGSKSAATVPNSLLGAHAPLPAMRWKLLPENEEPPCMSSCVWTQT